MHDMAFEVVMQSLTASCARLITGGITALDGAYALAGGRNAFSCWRAQDIWGLGFTEQAAEAQLLWCTLAASVIVAISVDRVL